jgi:hypothetical protein
LGLQGRAPDMIRAPAGLPAMVATPIAAVVASNWRLVRFSIAHPTAIVDA